MVQETQTEEEYQLELKRYKIRMEAYRALNESLMCQAASNFSKYTITLSAGALGLSLTFVSTLLQGKALALKGFLYLSWAGWALAIVCILSSFASSSRSYSTAIDQVDEGRIHNETPGGRFTFLTKILGRVGGLSFLIAVISICVFVGSNMKGAS